MHSHLLYIKEKTALKKKQAFKKEFSSADYDEIYILIIKNYLYSKQTFKIRDFSNVSGIYLF